LTTTFMWFYHIFFHLTSFFHRFCSFILAKPIYKRFKRLIKEYNPDMILTVNPIFVGSIRRCLKRMKLNIPLCVCIIDLVNHSHLWHEKKACLTFVPTQKMKDYLIKKGFQPEKVFYSGFPINTKYENVYKVVKDDILVPEVLMVNPSLKRAKVIKNLILTTLKHQLNLTVVIYNNPKLKKYLEKRLKNLDKLTILDYVNDMPTRLAQSDLLITKAGPNMILEAVKMGVPLVITGYIVGQEAKNHEYIVENGYGLFADTPKKLDQVLTKMFANNYEELKNISHRQASCPDINGASIVAQEIIKLMKEY